MKYLRLVTSSAVISLLAACSSSPAVPESGKPPIPAENSMLAKPSQPMESTQEATNEQTPVSNNESNITTNDLSTDVATLNQSSTQATSELILIQNNNHQLVAKATTQWNKSKQGDLYIKWIAPKGTTCHSTQLPITKYKDSNDISIAKRPTTSLYTDKPCNGIWTAEVVDKKGQTLTSATADVEEITAP